MRAAAIIAAIIVVIIVAVVAITGYQQYRERQAVEELQFEVDGVSIESVDLETAHLNFTLRVTNPSGNQATIDRTNYTVYINNISLGTSENQGRVTIPAGTTVLIPQPFVANNSGAAQGAWQYLTNDQVEWRIAGTAYYDTLLGTVSVNYERNGTTPGALSGL